MFLNQQQQHQIPVENKQNILIEADRFYASQPNFCFERVSKMSHPPKKIGHNMFGFPSPRKVYLKAGLSQNIRFNLALCFPHGTIPIFRPTLELMHNRDKVHCKLLNSQDGSTYVTNLTMNIRNNNKHPISFEKGTVLVSVLIQNALSDLHLIEVSKISYDVSDSNRPGVVSIQHSM